MVGDSAEQLHLTFGRFSKVSVSVPIAVQVEAPLGTSYCIPPCSMRDD
jgi:hypothetical protein